MTRHPEKILLLGLILTTLVGGAAAESLLIEGLEEKPINRSFSDSGVNYSAEYLDKQINWKNNTYPDELHSELSKWTISTTDKENSFEMDFQSEWGTSAPDYLAGRKVNEKISIKKGETKGTLWNGTYSDDTGNKVMEIEARSHYEHLVLEYRMYDSNGNHVETYTNKYSGEDPGRFPFSYTNTRTTEEVQVIGQGLDNLHEPQKEITYVVAFDSKYNFSELRTSKSYTVLNDPEKWFNESQDRVQENNLSQELLVEDTSNKKFKAFNLTLDANSEEKIEAVLETGNEDYVAGINTYVLGSIGGTTTYNAASGGGLLIDEGFEDGDYTNNYLWEEVDGTFDIKEVNSNQVHSGNYALQLGHNAGSAEWARMRYQNGENVDVKDKFKFSMYIDEVDNGNKDRVRTQIYDAEGNAVTYFTLADNNLCDSTADDGDVCWKISNSVGTEEYTNSLNPDQQYYTFELKNIDRNAGTSDIYVNGNLAQSDATTGIETNPISKIYAYSRYDETIAYFDDFMIGNPNSAPIIEEENTEPTNWSINTGIDLGFNASDPDGDSIEVWAQMLKNDTVDKDWTQLNTGTEYDYELTDFYTPSETNNYTLKVKANDTNGGYNISETTQEISNAPPSFQNVKTFRSFQKTGSLAYCSRNDVKYSSGTSTIDFNDFQVEDPSKNHTLVVARIKNSNSMDVLVNNNVVGTLGSTTGSGCNGDNWIVNTLEVDSSRLSDSTDITLSPSGTDDNYVYYVALREKQETNLFRESWDYLIEMDVEDPEGQGLNKLKQTTDGFDILSFGYNPDTKKGIDFGPVPDSTTSQTYNFEANDTNDLQNTKSVSLDIDYQKPSISSFYGFKSERLINYNESGVEISVDSNISDPENNLVTPSCSIGSAGTTVQNGSNDKYNCTATVSDYGTFYPSFTANDSVDHTNSRNTTVKVTEVSRVVNPKSMENPIFVGNSSRGQDNLTSKPIRFRLNHDLDVLGTANVSAALSHKIEATGLINASFVGNETASLNTSSQVADYDIQTGNNESNNDTSRTLKMDVWANAFEYAYQNDASDAKKRYFKLRTNNTYNYSLTGKVTFRLPQDYDPYEDHVVLKRCTSIDTWVDYSCGGNWETVKQTGKDLDGDDRYEATTFDVGFSDKLFFADVVDGGELEEETSSDTTTSSPTGDATKSGTNVGSDLSGLQGWLSEARYVMNLGGIQIPLNIFNIILMTIGGLLIWKRDEVQDQLGGTM